MQKGKPAKKYSQAQSLPTDSRDILDTITARMRKNNPKYQCTDD